MVIGEEEDGRPRDHVDVKEEPLVLQALIDRVQDGKVGAIATFLGTTREEAGAEMDRGNTPARQLMVKALHYEAYVPMAIKKMLEICQILRQRYPDIHHIALEHRTGRVDAKAMSVACVVSSPHRKDALAAVADAIDLIKDSVPIWKKEEKL